MGAIFVNSLDTFFFSLFDTLLLLTLNYGVVRERF